MRGTYAITDETWSLVSRRILAGLWNLSKKSENTSKGIEYFNLEAILYATPNRHDFYGSLNAQDVREAIEQYEKQGLVQRASIINYQGKVLSDGAAAGYRADLSQAEKVKETIGNIRGSRIK